MRSPRRPFALSYVIASLFWAAPTFVNASVTICEGELDPVKALISLLEEDLKSGTLGVMELEQSFNTQSSLNPYSLKPKSIQNISARRGFQKFSRRLSDSQRQELRAQIPLIVARNQAHSSAINSARENTADFISLKVEQTLDAASKDDPIFVGFFKGHQVLVHKMRYRGKSGYYLIDFGTRSPTHEPEITFITEGTSRGGITSATGGHIFEWQGRSYFADGLSFFAYDLETQQRQYFGVQDLAILEPKERDTHVKHIKFVPLGNVLRVLVETEDRQPNQPDFKGGLRFVDFVGPQKIPKPIFEEMSTAPINVSLIDSDKPLIAMHSRMNAKAVKFFDVSQSEPQLVSSLTVDDDRVEANCPPIAFTHKGTRFALVLTSTRYGVPTLRLYNLQTEKLLQNIDLGDLNPKELVAIKFHEIGGHPYAFLFSDSGLTVLDLVSRTVAWTVPEKFRRQVRPFRMGDQDLLLFTTVANELQVRDVVGGTLRDRLKTQDLLENAVPFVTEDGPMAFAVHSMSDPPKIVKLSRRSSTN